MFSFEESKPKSEVKICLFEYDEISHFLQYSFELEGSVKSLDLSKLDFIDYKCQDF